jgi:hypothetical protein
MGDPAYAVLAVMTLACPWLVRWTWMREDRKRRHRIDLLWGRVTA